MKKMRLILSLIFLSTAFSACASTLTAPDDCMSSQTADDCGWPGSDG